MKKNNSFAFHHIPKLSIGFNFINITMIGILEKTFFMIHLALKIYAHSGSIQSIEDWCFEPVSFIDLFFINITLYYFIINLYQCIITYDLTDSNNLSAWFLFKVATNHSSKIWMVLWTLIKIFIIFHHYQKFFSFLLYFVDNCDKSLFHR